MKKTLFCFGSILLLLTNGLSAQSTYPVEVLRDSAGRIPFVFEGEIVSSDIFVGSAEGVENLAFAVEWKDSIGTIPAFSVTKFPFVKSEIKINRSFKGKRRLRGKLTLFHQLSAIEDIWLEATPRGDTLVRYALTPGTTMLDAFNLFVPGPGFSPRRLFFCRYVRETKARAEESSIQPSDIFLQIPLEPGNDRIDLHGQAHSGLFPVLLYSNAEMEKLLNDL